MSQVSHKLSALPKNILMGLEQLDMGQLETEYEQGRSITPADEDGSDTWSGVFEEDSELEQEEVKDDDSALVP
ncbi:hypothetical protein THAOC_12473, partial [Thalassiosira oceanica]